MNDCIEWQGNRNERGYGRKWVGGRKGRLERAHRLAYVGHHGLAISDIEGLMVLHSCDNPPCINPDHLRLGTHSDNMADASRRARMKGERRGGDTKFNDVAVRVVRQLAAEGRSQKEIAAAYGVSFGTISKIVLRTRWDHVQ